MMLMIVQVSYSVHSLHVRLHSAVGAGYSEQCCYQGLQALLSVICLHIIRSAFQLSGHQKVFILVTGWYINKIADGFCLYRSLQ